MALTETEARLAVIEALLRLLNARVDLLDLKHETRGNEIMATLAEIQEKAAATLAQVQAETDVVNAVKMVVDNQNSSIAGLKQQIADLIAAGGADATALQTLSDTIDHIQQQDTSNAAVVAAAVAAGTPAQP